MTGARCIAPPLACWNKRDADELDANAALLAKHYAEAGDEEKTYLYAGARATRRGASAHLMKR